MNQNTDISVDLTQNLFARIAEYDPDFERSDVQRAVEFAVEHHGEQKRLSGEPYYLHPIQVAEILTEMQVDTDTIITAILHDTVEDTDVTTEDIKEKFGEKIAILVDGVTKLTKIEFQSENHKQAENFRKLLVAISEDIRVLLVKLADRLHNMRTLHHIKKPEKRRRIAHETMEIYASLAERIGMHKFKEELQDLAFRELNPDAYNSITNRLEYLRKQDKSLIERIAAHLKNLLTSANIPAEISGREKKPYSIWCKMQKKNVTFEQITDIVAFRIITDNKDNCYRALGIIHDTFHMIPESFNDYISTMKSNGYQSIHTVVMGPELQRIEVQIRSQTMHEIAEFGVAAHWAYKQGHSDSIEQRKYRWIREMLHIIEQVPEPEEFLKNTRLEIYQDQVFCFTPRGDLIALPSGATPVDFAFAVHSAVGRHCAGAKINGRIVPLRARLKNGDQVEIIRSKKENISPSWEGFAVTGKALSEIRRFIRTQQRDEYIKLGREIITKTLKHEHEELGDKTLEPLVEKYNKNNVDDIYMAVGEGSLSRNEVMNVLFPEKRKKPSLLDRFKRRDRQDRPDKSDERISIPIVGLIPGMAIHFAGCCHPLPGEQIVGIVNTGKGVTIHTADCGELENFADSPERWIDVTWQDEQEEMFIARLKVTLSHKKGSLGELANTIAKGAGNINNLRITNRTTDFFDMIVDVELRDVGHMNSMIALLRSQPDILEAGRYMEGR